MNIANIEQKIRVFSENTPDKIAIEFGEKKISYLQLNEITNKVANFLMDKYEDAKNVFIMTERGPAQIEALIGVVKSGGIFIPVDPTVPDNRIITMLQEVESNWIITTSTLVKRIDEIIGTIGIKMNVLIMEPSNSARYCLFHNLNIFYMDDISGVDKTNEYFPNKHCYIYFTSGSTGKPKGVLGRHRSLMQFIEWEIREFGINSEFRVSQLTSPSFDPFLRDVFVPLCAGGTLCIPNDGELVLNPVKLIDWIENNHITLIHTVPSVFKEISNEIGNTGIFSNLKYILLAGEILRGNDIKKFIDMFGSKVQLVNLYGPTETTLAKLFYRIDESDRNRAIIPVGKPIDFTDVLILNEHLEMCPTSIVGEIYIRTPFITSGYCNNKELTKKVFLKNPFTNNPKDIIYKTGDLGRMFSDGKVEIVGRADNQVKIRGMRIELGEIENALLQHKVISEAIVMIKEDEDTKYLCAYITSNEKLKINELREFLLKYLPENIIPSQLIQVDKMPLTTSGKIDRKKLLEMQGLKKSGTAYVAPKNEIEENLVKMWQTVLKQEEIGVESNFFEAGGHSLKAAKIIGEIHRKFNVEISFSEFFKLGDIRRISEYIELAEKSTYIPIEKVEEREYYPVSSAQRRMYILNQLNPESTNYNLPIILKVKGKLNTDKIEKVMYNFILRHESLRTSFHVIDGEIMQKINKRPTLNIKYSNCIEENVDEVIKKFIKPFNLKDESLLRLDVVTMSDEEYILMFDKHHIISDGYSTVVFIKEFLDLYQGTELEELRIQYKDYSVWENKLFESNEIKKQEEFWLSMFNDEITTLNMPLDFSRTDNQILNGNRIKFEVSKEIVEKMNDLARREETTLNIVLFSIYNLLLSQYSEQNDITSGLSIAGRNHPDLERLIGVFINFLPIRTRIDFNSSFCEFLQEEKNLIIKSYDNQNYPFDELVAKVVKKQDNSRNPIFDSMFILHNQYDGSESLKIEGLDFEEIEMNRNTSKLDFQIDAGIGSKGNLICSLEYNTSLFKEETMKGFIKHFNMLINKVVENPENRLVDMGVLSKEELLIIQKKRYNNSLNKKKLPLVITSTFTDEPIGEYIKWWCKQFNEEVSVEFAPYNQVYQQLLDTSSLVSKNSGINIVLVRFEDWIRNIKSEEEKCNILERNFNDLIKALKNQNKESIFLIGEFPVSTHLMLSDKIIKNIQELNIRIKESLKDIKNAYLINFSEIDKNYNIKEVFDAISDKEGHIPFTDEYYAAMGTVIARKICAIRKPSFKVIVLDCDNTLWKGICGEDGALGIKIEEPYKEFQRFLIQKHDEGMLLVLCSKNNEKDVLETFEKNTEMLLKKEHLASWRINWKNKSDNIRELADELNLSLDSFIFIDDDSLECSQVMMNCPEVLTLQLPLDYSMIPMYIRHVWAFDREKITKEDEKRTQMYLAEKQRKNMLDKKLSIDNFLENLQIKMSMNLIKDENITRISQLTQRTNQFNLSTIRRTEEEIRQLIKDENINCWVVEVADRFGEYGLVGLVIAEKKGKTLLIDSFLLSCRVLGRGIDNAMLSGIGRYCENESIESIVANFYPTAKNRPFKDFIESGKWEKTKETDSYIQYKLQVEDITKSIDFVECYYDSSYNKEIKDNEQDAISEIACYIQPDRCTYPISKVVNSEINWEVPIVNEEGLVHLNQLLALSNYSGAKLLKLPINQQINNNLLIHGEYEAPRTEVEERLVKIWLDILKVTKVGINDNFFNLGGHSLKAISLVSKVHKEFNIEIPLEEVFKRPTIAGICEYMNSSQKNIYSSIKSVEERDSYKVSSAQKRLFTLNQFVKNEIHYNITSIFVVEGKLEKERARDIFTKLVERHEAFRTSFELREGEILQIIHKEVEFDVEYVEVNEDNEEIVKEMAKNFIKPFDLSKAPLLRVKLLRIEQEKHIVMVDMHHIISDGTTMGILIREFSQLYKGEVLEELRIQYKDYAAWQNQFLNSDGMRRQQEYWMKVFNEEIPTLEMPTDYRRPTLQSFEGESISFSIDKDLTGKIRKIGVDNGTTMYMTLLSIYNVLLSKYSGQEDIVVGSPISGRPHVDLEKIAGMFVNTLPMRNYPNGEKTFKEFLQDIKKNALNAYENQNYQFDDLVEKLNLKRDLSRNPLFDTMFILENTDVDQINLEELRSKSYGFSKSISKFDLTLKAVDLGEKIEFKLEYCTKLFKKETAEKITQHFLNILKNIVDNPEIRLKDVEMIGEEEKNKILNEFNHTYADYPRDKTIHEIFEEQVEKTPDNIAVVFENRKLTYRELNEKSNRLARTLRSKGIGPNSIVGIMSEKSLELIVGIIGILKAGAAYLPIEPEYPQDRISYMLKDSRTNILLTQTHLVDRVSFVGEIIDLLNNEIYSEEKENLENINTSKDLSYVIYTSGSAGNPKGVMIEHRNVMNYITYLIKKGDIRNIDKTVILSSLAFDLSYTALYPLILSGCEVHIVKKETYLAKEKILKYIYDNKITFIKLTPSLFNALFCSNDSIQIKKCKCLRLVVLGGEPINVDDVEKFNNILPETVIMNHYGPTETTIGVIVNIINFENFCSYKASPVIGQPIDGIKAYIMNINNNIQPIGVPGELCISGEGVARGYLNNAELTSERFIENPFVKGERMYRTGDLARWLPEGNIEFLGRIDHQVKIRGFRIELGEIENNILTYEGIKEVVVIDKKDDAGNKYLCAYVISDNEIVVGDIREHLSSKLPDYMVPSYFMQIEKIPLTLNGKIDKNALLNLECKINTGVEYEAPRNEVEEKLCGVWQEVLGIENISINDSFFELGGDSIKTIQIVARLKKYGYTLEMSDIFKNPRIKELGKCVKNIDITFSQDIVEGSTLLTPIQEWFFEMNFVDKHHYNQAVMLYKKERFDEEIVKAVFEKILIHHDALRMIYKISGNNVVQTNRGDYGKEYDFEMFEFRNKKDYKEEITKECCRMQGSIDIEKGPLVKIGLFKTDEGDHMLIVIHHLVVDGVSWRILLEDFTLGYNQYINCEKIVFQDKGSSYKEWAQRLKEYCSSKRVLKELHYWNELGDNKIEPLPTDYECEKSTIENTKTIDIIFSIEETKNLIKNVNVKYNTEINDILLTALGLTIKECMNQDKVLINLEGHGREQILEGVDISRTIGWFTTHYPVILDMTKSTEISYNIKSIKENLRHIPNKGIGYGILRYLPSKSLLNEKVVKLHPEIAFNYLGQFDQDIPISLFEMSRIYSGNLKSFNNDSLYKLSFNGIVVDNKLSISLTYSSCEYCQETIENILAKYRDNLCAIIEHCVSKEQIELTPSDLGDDELTLDELEFLSNFGGEE